MQRNRFFRWLPSLAVMAVIFCFSSMPLDEMIHFGLWDVLVRKAAHMLVYGLLALTYWYGFRFDNRRGWLAVILAVVYALTDEFHQSFVPGRHPSWIDIIIFDGGGASAFLGLAYFWRTRVKRH